MRRSLAARAALLPVLLLVSGCGMKPIQKFSAYPERSPSVQKVAVIADVFVVRDVLGSLDAISIPKNLEYGQMLVRRVDDGLAAAGYVVEFSTVAGIALSAVLTSTPTLKRDGVLPGEDEGVSPPLAIDPAFASSPEKLEALTETMRALEGFQFQKSGGPDTWPVCRKISGIMPADVDAVIVLTVRRRDIPFYKKLQFSYGTGFGSAGFMPFWGSAHPIIGSTVALHLVDVRTGELLWSDNHVNKHNGQMPTVDELNGQVKKLMARLPKRN